MTKASSPIALAVEPRRAAAIERALRSASAYVERVESRLVECGMDMNVAYPYPKTTVGRAAYKQALAARHSAQTLTRSLKSSLRMGEPHLVAMSPEGVDRFLLAVESDASASFDAYVAKLDAKVGEVSVAEINASPLWDGSILTVRTIAGAVERWSTKQILNVSVLGTLFNQWPTRRMA